MTMHQLYDERIKPLSAAERLQLATLILNNIPPQSVVDYSSEWSEEDLRDWSRASWQHTDAVLGEDKDV